jgi:hypothetical protein
MPEVIALAAVLAALRAAVAERTGETQVEPHLTDSQVAAASGFLTLEEIVAGLMAQVARMGTWYAAHQHNLAELRLTTAIRHLKDGTLPKERYIDFMGIRAGFDDEPDWSPVAPKSMIEVKHANKVRATLTEATEFGKQGDAWLAEAKEEAARKGVAFPGAPERPEAVELGQDYEGTEAYHAAMMAYKNACAGVLQQVRGESGQTFGPPPEPEPTSEPETPLPLGDGSLPGPGGGGLGKKKS